MIDQACVSVVVCTRNRSAIAVAKARWALAQAQTAEAIFVVDHADDDTVPRLQELAEHDDRLKVIPLPRRTGLPGARNAGIRAATAEWILLFDDDDIPSDGFLPAVLGVAEKAGASIVGTPWFYISADQDLDRYITDAPRRPGGPELDRPGFFPEQEWEECLWFTINALFRRSIFVEIGFDAARYRGNYYREDTDLLVSAARAGHRVVVTSLAYNYLRQRATGGVERRSRLIYEYWVLRNNWTFLRKHGSWLRETGRIDGVLRAQARLARRRARWLAGFTYRRITGASPRNPGVTGA